MDLERHIRDVPDFPKKGIIFKDITPLVGNPDALREAADRLAEPFRTANVQYVAAIEARGFIFGALVAERLGAGFVPIRKPGKLPAKTISHSYALEYGENTLEIHTDAIPRGARVLVIDDVLAIGGTLGASTHLLEQLGADIVAVAVVVELAFLSGRDKLEKYNVHSLIQVAAE